jgi:SAM-dependent MidA family methyltransferase
LHRFADPLSSPGETDLTAHVDFEALTRAARRPGVLVSRVVPQGRWLEVLGIAQRAAALASANPERAEEIDSGRRRLCDPGAMGDLFKVMAISGRDWPLPAGLDP